MKLNIIKTIILFIISIGFILFTSTAKTVIEGLSYKSSNDAIITLDEESNMLRTTNDRSIVCCDNYSYAPNVKCVKQLNQNTCILPNSDGTCSGANYTSEELGALQNGNQLETCKIPLTQGNYLTNSSTLTTVDTLEPDTVSTSKKQVYKDNLFYSETYSPNTYAFFSRESEKCCFDAPQKIVNTTDEVISIPEQYQCPIGWDLVTNVCTDTCGPCTTRTKDTPESVTYPNTIKTSKTINDGYVYTNIIDDNDNYGYNTLTAAPFLL
jgi:hypothetical protein